jgi:hypothetical protein
MIKVNIKNNISGEVRNKILRNHFFKILICSGSLPHAKNAAISEGSPNGEYGEHIFHELINSN